MVEKSQYKSLNEWRKNDESAYKMAFRRGLILELCEIFGWKKPKRGNNYWTKIKVLKDAKLYNNPTDWSIASSGAYDYAQRYGLYVEAIQHMSKLRQRNGFWTKEKCLIEARKYTNRRDWRKAYKSSWTSAQRLGCYDECTKHMKSLKDGRKKSI